MDQGVKDLYQFRDLLLEELEKGVKIKIQIKGFASPLAKTDYNVNLTKRRISSFINYLMEYNNGVFQPYITDTASNGGYVTFVGVPFGEYTANQLTSDNFHDQKNSVYSRAAAIERKIEIQSVSYIDNRKEFPLLVSMPVFDAGKVKAGVVIEHSFEITNQSKEIVQLENLSSPFETITISSQKNEIQPGEKVLVTLRFDTAGFAGRNMKYAEFSVMGFEENQKLMITSEIE